MHRYSAQLRRAIMQALIEHRLYRLFITEERDIFIIYDPTFFNTEAIEINPISTQIIFLTKF